MNYLPGVGGTLRGIPIHISKLEKQKEAKKIDLSQDNTEDFLFST